MSGMFLIGVIVGLGFLFLIALAVLLDIPIPFLGSGLNDRGQIRSLLSTQRKATPQRHIKGQPKTTLFDAAKEAPVRRVASSRLTLRKRLKYAQWKLPPVLYRLGVIATSGIIFCLVSLKFNIVVQIMALFSGPLFMGWMLNGAIDRRFRAFDADYPAFLLSLVGLLKTGMNPMGALEAAAQGLQEGSVVKAEVEMMIERLRFGVSEDKSIGTFGEDIHHPEIELFVQALLLSRRVGGNLSDTLDRLAKQVRKRQYFRLSANAAVGMQRGSIWFILSILVALEVYLYFVFPESVIGAWNDPIGKQVWQVGVAMMILGIYWVRQVTKIRT